MGSEDRGDAQQGRRLDVKSSDSWRNEVGRKVKGFFDF